MCSTGEGFTLLFSAPPRPHISVLCSFFAVTRSGKEFSLYSLGQPVRCSIDAADILRARVAELDDGCTSEDELQLEGDQDDEELSEADVPQVRPLCFPVTISDRTLDRSSVIQKATLLFPRHHLRPLLASGCTSNKTG